MSEYTDWADRCADMTKMGAVAIWRGKENPSLIPSGWVLVDRWGFWMPPEIASRLGPKFRSTMVVAP